jgi:glycosyltransferase involved in cell wall biosynthesis
LILAEDCGIVVEPGDAWGLAHQLSQLSQDPNRVTAMGDRARALYERRFGLERSLAAYEALLYDPYRP